MITFMKAFFRVFFTVFMLAVWGCGVMPSRQGGVPDESYGEREAPLEEAEEAGLFQNRMEAEELAAHGLAAGWWHDLRRDDGRRRVRRFDVTDGRLVVETLDAQLLHMDVAAGEWRGVTRLKDVLTAPPAMHGDFVYAHTFRGMAAVGARSGVISRRFSTRIPVKTRPVPYGDGALILGSRTGAVVMFDTVAGVTKWTRTVYGAVLEPVTVRGDRVFAAGSRRVLMIDAPSGEVLGEWRPESDIPVTTGPVVRDGNIYVGMGDGFLYCLHRNEDAAGLGVAWRFPAGAPITGIEPAKDGVLIVSTAAGEVVVLDSSPEPHELWSHPRANRYLLSGERGLYFLSRDRQLILLRPESGEEIWSIPLQKDTLVASSPEASSLLLASPEGFVMALVER